MAYTAETITAGDPILATWGNKVETNLDRVGEYMGVVAAVANLPDVATVSDGDWYWCKAERLAKMKIGSVYLTLNGIGEVASSAPSSVTGLLWYDTTNKVFKIYSGSAWIPIGGTTIDTSQALSSLQSALTVQNPSVVLAALANSDFADYLLGNSSFRSELVNHRVYMNALMKFAYSTVTGSNDYMDAVLNAKWPYASEMNEFWSGSSLLQRWLDNFWTIYSVGGYATFNIGAVNSQYGFVLYVSNSYSTYNYMQIDLDFTEYNDLDLWAELIRGSSYLDCEIYIGATKIQDWYNSSASIAGANYNYDVSGFSGVQTLKIQFKRTTTVKITSLRLS